MLLGKFRVPINETPFFITGCKRATDAPAARHGEASFVEKRTGGWATQPQKLRSFSAELGKLKSRRRSGIRAITDELLLLSEIQNCAYLQLFYDGARPRCPHGSGQGETRLHLQNLPGLCASYAG